MQPPHNKSKASAAEDKKDPVALFKDQEFLLLLRRIRKALHSLGLELFDPVLQVLDGLGIVLLVKQASAFRAFKLKFSGLVKV